ncbi:type II toxin-antitoxin system RelE/ParE family toxin [Luteolibacter yonseiensis]|uniref:Type II toxin-antitoxin system RelE/ParE family toxin n=1 Tax=Luteolibacter yonseiensis TaxID=1144680 RepID=A0A934VD62_9BACT|nr:type II toxin-antitoxin system RelE/ParE family toxin [Luteolibacter yonseiensis]
MRYIAQDDHVSAKRFGDHLISKVDKLVLFPRIGRTVPEFHDDLLREIIVSPYRIVYEIDDGRATIAVLRIWHGARGELQFSR